MPQEDVIERVLKFSQAALRAAPAIILGSGSSVPHGVPGMAALADHFQRIELDRSYDDREVEAWTSFQQALRLGVDLESALQANSLPDRLTARIVDDTRDLILQGDLGLFRALLSDRSLLPLSRLYRHLFGSTHRAVSVVTTNYDRIAEYAADAAGFGHFTGFDYGHIQHRTTHAPQAVGAVVGSRRIVNVWKVHGSLDWFRGPDQQVFAARACITVPAGMRPVMVTPGIDKYRITHAEPFRTVFSRADEALLSAPAFFCIGYGFNDEHVQPKLIERCQNDETPLVILAKELTPATRGFLAGGQCRNFLAIEHCEGGSRVYFDSSLNPEFVPDMDLWSLGSFIERVI